MEVSLQKKRNVFKWFYCFLISTAIDFNKEMKDLITGITGQDGSYLAEFLLNKGYKVYGVVRRSSTENFSRIDHIKSKIILLQADLLDQLSLISAIKESDPDEVYNLAA